MTRVRESCGSNVGEVVRRWHAYLIMVVLIAFGVYRANDLRWFCDDTFITLRYVENLLAGRGLVYNPGEFVEGYTHPLWLAILALSGRTGLDPLGASLNIGLVSYACVIALFCLIAYRLNHRRLALFVPFTGLALALHYDFRVWATSGMETMFYTFLLSLAFFTYFFSGLGRKAKPAVTGLILTLAVATRPDGILVLALGNLFLVLRALLRRSGAKRAGADLIFLNLCFVCLYVPYFLWKYGYYGDFFPNSYHAKSGGLSYYGQGFYYLWTYFKAYLTSWLFVLGVPVIVKALSSGRKGAERRRSLRTRIEEACRHPHFAALCFALSAIVLYSTIFIARVGGGFMYARFLIPVIPFILFVIEVSVIELVPERKGLPAVVFLVLALVIGTVERSSRDRLLLGRDDGDAKALSLNGIVDERHYYKDVYDIEQDAALGRYLEPYFQGLDATVLLVGQACLGYYAGFETCIENFGLTDRFIAHLPLEKRARIGHEKEAPFPYLNQRGTDFVFSRRQRYPYRMTGYRLVYIVPSEEEKARVGLEADRVQAELISYDRDLIAGLSRRMGGQFHFIDFEGYLDEYIEADLTQKEKMEVLRDYSEFKQFYFMHNSDPDRERAFLKVLGSLAGPGPR